MEKFDPEKITDKQLDRLAGDLKNINEIFCPTKESIEAYKRAFNARLAYEKNCIAKYDFPDHRPSITPPKGERMSDFAFKFGTTIEEMKECLPDVEKFLQKNPQT